MADENGMQRPVTVDSMIDFSDGTLRREQDLCREKLNEVRRRFTDHQNRESREEYLLTLRMFSDLVMGKRMGKRPTED
jgi:hypothetical protein